MRHGVAWQLWSALGLCLVAACSGGDEPVVVAGPGPAPGEPPGGDHDGYSGNPFDLPSSSSNGGSCLDCQDVLSGGQGAVCSSVQSALYLLGQCACAICQIDCTSVCGGGIIDSPCNNCLASNCQIELSACLGS